MIDRIRRDNGIALIVVLGVLALLSVLAISFISITRLERSISRNYVNQTRAILAAESGVEYAIARINEFQGGVLRPQEIGALNYEEDPARPGLEFMVKPSFHLSSPDESYSGVVSSTHARNGDVFKLKVEDESGKLNLNDTDGAWNLDTDPDPDDPATDNDILTAPGRLRMMLTKLGDVLFGIPKGVEISSVLFEARENLPGKRFSRMREIKDLLVPDILDEIDFSKFAKYVTLYSWQDPNVIRPTFQLNITVHPDQRAAGIPQNSWDDSWDIYLFFDMQTREYEIEPRCPVNVNAASAELLEALIAPIQGWYLYEGPAESKLSVDYYDDYYTGTSGYTFEDQGGRLGRQNIHGQIRISEPIGDPKGLSEVIWEYIHGIDINGDNLPAEGTPCRPLSTWEEFRNFLEQEAAQYIEPACGYDALMSPEMNADYTDWWRDYFKKIYIDLLLANFNPNSRLNDFNPDRHIYQHVDKAQLTQYTTELCFEPTGCFEIESLGQIRDENQDVIAGSSLCAIVELWKMHRITTQAQFLDGLADDMSNLGDYFSLNEQGTLPTSGYKFDPGAGSTAGGFTLQSYPEPLVDEDSAFIPDFVTDRNYVDDSYYDGFLSLAPYRLRSDYCLNEYPARFVCNFETTLKPETFGEAANSDLDQYFLETGEPIYSSLATDDMVVNYMGAFEFEEATENMYWNYRSYRLNTNQPTAMRLTNNKEDYGYSKISGVLHPDGGLSDPGRTLAYNLANVGREWGCIGTIEFWMKPNYDPAISNRIRTIMSKQPQRGDIGGIPVSYTDQDGWLFYLPNGSRMQEVDCGCNVAGSCVPLPFTTHSIVFGWWSFRQLNISGAREIMYYGRVTETTNHNWPGHINAENHGGDGVLYNFEKHEWSHILISWDRMLHAWQLGCQESRFVNTLLINGQAMADHRSWNHGVLEPIEYKQEKWRCIDSTIDPSNPPDYCLRGPGAWKWKIYANAPANVFRFGEFVSKYEHMVVEDDEMFWPLGTARNWACDSTIADIAAYANGPYNYEAYLTGSIQPSDFGNNYEYGRYLSQVDSEDTAGQYWSAPLDLHKVFPIAGTDMQFIPRSVTWTLYWPRRNRDSSDPNNYTDIVGVNVDGDSLDSMDSDDLVRDEPLAAILEWPDAWDPICVDIAMIDSYGEDWYYENDKSIMATSPAGTDFNRRNPLGKYFSYSRFEQFRFSVYFNLEAGQVLYQSPVLDDITFTFTLSRPKILLWQVQR
ncbi:PilX N-terminal domain-containing pilus assembly protein [Planctomycetota bacterium]